ncbi:recombinase family protein [Caulobacter sp. FWC2]|uniref:recombinase family protein n=1 Tax=Caulobacter sp. FWC2 TaxID=69664 RepID=UPI00130462DA|nr:recombinase family protein [Caulobacter sp. FWC2]
MGIYARYSTQNQTQESIERQVINAERFAATRGWIVAGTWEDAERSGTTFVGRTGFFQMMAAAEEGTFQVLLVEDISRLSRKSGDTHALFDELAELGIDVCTVAGGRLVEGVDVMVGAFKNSKDVEEAAYRSRGGQVRVIESGRSSGNVPYGYRKVFGQDGRNGVREADQKKALVVQRIFEETAAGLSPNQICSNLNREGVPGPRGKGWRPGALVGAKQIGGGILRNTIYVGEIRWGKTERKRRKGKIANKQAPAEKIVTAFDPSLAIVQRDLFDQVQGLLAGKKSAFFKYKKAQYVFTGKYRCGHCGETMIVLSGRLACTGRNVKGADCQNRCRIPREDAERAVLQGLSEKLLQPALIEPCIDAYRTEAEKASGALQQQRLAGERRLEQIGIQIANLWPMINDSATPPFAKQALLTQLNALEEERQRLELELKQRPPASPAGLEADAIVARLREMVSDLSNTLQGGERDAVIARDTLRTMVDVITLNPDLATADRRGSAVVHLTVEGSLTKMLSLADVIVERDIKHRMGPRTTLDVATIGYAFSSKFSYYSERLAGVLADIPFITRLLERAQAPLTKAQMVNALRDDEGPSQGDKQPIEDRVRYVLDQLQKRGETHTVPVRQTWGWVLSDTPVSDEEWVRRAKHRPEEGALPRIMKGWAPEASVVVIGGRG